MRISSMLLVACMVVSCGTKKEASEKLQGDPGPPGQVGQPGQDGAPGSSCSVVETAEGADIVCDDGSAVSVLSGVDGEDGSNGEDGTSCTTQNIGGGASITCGETVASVDDGDDCIVYKFNGTNCNGHSDNDILSIRFLCGARPPVCLEFPK